MNSGVIKISLLVAEQNLPEAISIYRRHAPLWFHIAYLSSHRTVFSCPDILAFRNSLCRPHLVVEELLLCCLLADHSQQHQHYMQSHRHHRERKKRQQHAAIPSSQDLSYLTHLPPGGDKHQAGYPMEYSQSTDITDNDLTQSTEQGYEVCKLFYPHVSCYTGMI